MRLQFADNPAYNKYETLLIQLHKLLAEGKNDTPEVDPVHDEMDECEPYLDSAEIQRLKGLSADLYMLQEKERFAKTNYSSEQIKEQCAEASQKEDWETVLALLRTGKVVSSPPELADLRARLYSQLGHTEASRQFRLYADKYDIQNAIAEYASIDTQTRERKSISARVVDALKNKPKALEAVK